MTDTDYIKIYYTAYDSYTATNVYEKMMQALRMKDIDRMITAIRNENFKLRPMSKKERTKTMRQMW